jgi:ribosomal protein S18 acetylase RimI-like enzyme
VDDNGLTATSLLVACNNTPARRLYRSAGFIDSARFVAI